MGGRKKGSVGYFSGNKPLVFIPVDVIDGTTVYALGVTPIDESGNVIEDGSGGLVDVAHDEIDITYIGDKMDTITFLDAGVPVAALQLSYAGENLINVARTL